jgi:pimeloyl-ACP methyl ester carboxylesterase
MRGALGSISGTRVEELNRAAGAALLDRIGPAIVLGRSQSGPFPWLYADARPDVVKAMVSLEPSGPPFVNVTFHGPPDYFADGPVGRPWGLTATPLTYAPPITDPEQLSRAQQATPDGPDLVRCWLQGKAAYQLPTLQGKPTLIITGQASYHAPYDHCTARYLQQAGVDVEHVRLEQVGILGNGHLMNSEANSDQIAAFLVGWLERKGL